MASPGKEELKNMSPATNDIVPFGGIDRPVRDIVEGALQKAAL